MADRLFSAHVAEHVHLEPLLIDRSRPARENAERIRPDEFQSMDDTQIVENLLRDWKRLAQALVPGDPHIPVEPAPSERRDPNGPERPGMWRWAVRFPVAGDTELLTRWPRDLQLDPCNDDEYFLPVPPVFWRMSAKGPVAYFDVPRDEDPTGTAPPTERILNATKYLRVALDAINTQVAAFGGVLRGELLEAVAARRDRLGEIAARRGDLIAMIRESLGPLSVEVAGPPMMAPVVAVPSAQDITLNYAVATGTFRDLLRATRKWRDGVEPYGEDFSQLDEEPITSLLVSALNLAFDTADREVFHAKGKTDILVRAEVGQPSQAAYIGEAKLWKGRAKVCPAVAQVVGYAIARTTDVMLVYYVKQDDLHEMTRRAHNAVEACDDFLRWAEDDCGDRVAVVRHPKFKTEVRVTLLFIHVPGGAEDPDG